MTTLKGQPQQFAFLSFLTVLIVIGVFFLLQGHNVGLHHQRDAIHPQLEAFRRSGQSQTLLSLQKQQKQTPKITLATFFQTLCHFQISVCCKEETRLHVLDTLSMTLGAIQGYTIMKQSQPKSKSKSQPNRPIFFDTEIPSYRARPLNCSHFPYEFRSLTPPRLAITNKEVYEEVFSGTELKQGRTFVDLVMVSYELDILEARLYELHHIVDFFCIFESSYNHRGWKKPRFVQTAMQQTNRFKPFLDKIIYINVDTCPEYMNEVWKERGRNKTIQSAGKDMWDIQNSLRICRWKLANASLPPSIPDDTLVICTDLDWFPQTSLLHHFKHCEPSTEYGYAKPFHMTMSHFLIHALRKGATPNYNDIPFAIHSILRIRELGGLPGGRGIPDRELDERNNKTIPFFCGGIHLQDLGTLANVIYRDVTHAEFAAIREEKILGGISYCNVTDEYLANKQSELSIHPDWVHWRFGRNGNPSNTSVDESIVLPAPTEEQLSNLRNSHVPWILIEHWEAFPFAWGYGKYSMYS